jgi:two-component system response regulator YesN
MSDLYSVVVIDDHRFIRESIIHSIDWKELGAEIKGEAQNGIEANELILRLKPDIIITDIRMPGIEGLDLVDRIRGFLPRSKIIVITGFQEFEYAQRALKLGVCDLILKPIKNDELIGAVRKAIHAIEQEKKMLQASSPEGNRASTESYGLLIDSILDYIVQHCTEDITLERVAREFQISTGYASRLIAKATGKGFVQHVCEQRIEAAKRCLSDPRMRIKEIVYACGFSEYSYFRKIFKKYTGCSPQQFRTQLVHTAMKDVKK